MEYNLSPKAKVVVAKYVRVNSNFPCELTMIDAKYLFGVMSLKNVLDFINIEQREVLHLFYVM